MSDLGAAPVGLRAPAALADPARPATGAPASRVANVDVLRAVAALAVLAVHAYALGGRAVPVRAQFLYDVPLIDLASGVWLFFAISGYVISRPFVEALIGGRPLPQTSAYALRRALRIFPLYWLALSAAIALEGTDGAHAWQLPFHYLLLNNLIPGQQESLFPVAWTLTLEVLFYASVPLLAALLGRLAPGISAERLAAIVAASWALSIAFTAVADLQGDGTIGLWLRGLEPAMWQMFCPGILIAIAPHLRPGRWRRWLAAWAGSGRSLLVAAAALLIAWVLSADAPLRFGIVAYQLLTDASRPLFAIGFGLLVAAAVRARAWGRRAPWALELGLVSYGIYLLHPVIFDVLMRAGLRPFPHQGVGSFAGNLAVLAGLTIPLALLSWRWFESPLIRLARALGSRGQRRRYAAPPCGSP